MTHKNIVIKLSGNLFKEENIRYLEEIKTLYIKLKEKYNLHFVVGGGKYAREYIKIGRSLNLNNFQLDKIGMNIARLNAMILGFFLGLDNVYFPIPTSSRELLEAQASKKTIIVGGLQPGQSTLTVSALLAELLNANKLIYLTSSFGLYTEDPKVNPNTELLSKTKLTEVEKYLKSNTLPGTYELIDKQAREIILRSKIYIYVTSFKEPQQIKNIIENKEFKGTIILPE